MRHSLHGGRGILGGIWIEGGRGAIGLAMTRAYAVAHAWMVVVGWGIMDLRVLSMVLCVIRHSVSVCGQVVVVGSRGVVSGAGVGCVYILVGGRL